MSAGSPYLVMEWLGGQSLGDLVKTGGALAVDRALELTRQILLGVEAIHGAQVVHRERKRERRFESARAALDALPLRMAAAA